MSESGRLCVYSSKLNFFLYYSCYAFLLENNVLINLISGDHFNSLNCKSIAT